MSKAKHTPGPWEAVGNLVRSPMFQPDGLPRGVQIVECMDGYFQPFTEEAKANAHLIAAAPELLDALEACRDALAWVIDQGGGPACEHEAGVCFCNENKALSIAHAAIAKATGQPA